MQDEVQTFYNKFAAEKDAEVKDKIANTIDVKIQAKKKEIIERYAQKQKEAFEN